MIATGMVSLPNDYKKHVRVKSIGFESLTFDDGSVLESYHDQDCYEHHYLSFADFTLKDLEDAIFDFSKEPFFEKVPSFGIRLLPINNHPIPVPGYSNNNGYYTDNLFLVLIMPDGTKRKWDISECQKEQ